MYSVDTLKRLRREAKSSRKIYVNRKDAIYKAYSAGFTFDDECSKIDKRIDECISELKNGIQNLCSVNGKCDNISNYKEKSVLTYQYAYSNSLNRLASEINRCNDRISSYNAEISQYEYQIKEQGGVILQWE